MSPRLGSCSCHNSAPIPLPARCILRTRVRNRTALRRPESELRRPRAACLPKRTIWPHRQTPASYFRSDLSEWFGRSGGAWRRAARPRPQVSNLRSVIGRLYVRTLHFGLAYYRLPLWLESFGIHFRSPPKCGGSNPAATGNFASCGLDYTVSVDQNYTDSAEFCLRVVANPELGYRKYW
jgi:hypothetical protein